MAEDQKSFGESARDSASVGHEQTGHGVEDVLAREDRGGKIERTERQQTEPVQRRESVPAADIPGNTSETGSASRVTGGGEQPGRRTLPSPLTRPAGCSAPTGVLLIATFSLLGALLKGKYR